jgi:hypothetical protein
VSLARETLAEIPAQVTTFMRMKGVKPNRRGGLHPMMSAPVPTGIAAPRMGTGPPPSTTGGYDTPAAYGASAAPAPGGYDGGYAGSAAPSGYPPAASSGFPPASGAAASSSGYPPSGYPPAPAAPSGYPPSGYPPSGYPPSGYPPASGAPSMPYPGGGAGGGGGFGSVSRGPAAFAVPPPSAATGYPGPSLAPQPSFYGAPPAAAAAAAPPPSSQYPGSSYPPGSMPPPYGSSGDVVARMQRVCMAWRA